MERARPSRRAFLKGVAAGAAALSWSGSPWRWAQAQSRDALTAVVKAGPASMEPTINNDPNLQLVANVYDGLLRRDINGRLVPGLATEWTRLEEDEWEFVLRSQVNFHNGRAFSAEDVRFTFERLREAFSQFQNFGSLIKDVIIDGPFRIRVLTDGAVPYFADNLHQIFILNRETDARRTLEEISLNPVGTGAYRLSQWRQGEFVDLEANTDYWDGEPPIRQVRHQQLDDETFRVAALKAGDAQLVQNVPVDAAESVRNDSTLSLQVRDGRQCIFFSPRVKGTPFSDLRVRQAFWHAIDSDSIIEVVMRDYATPAVQVPDAATVGFNPSIRRLPFDAERAQQLLDDAGFRNGFDLIIDVTNDQFVNEEGVGLAVAQDLERVGINVTEVRARPSSVFFADLAEQKLDFFIVGWFDGAYDFGRTAGNLLVSDAYFNLSGYSNPDFDDLIAISHTVEDPQQRAALLRQANRLAMDDVALIPLHYEGQVWGSHRDLKFTPRVDGWTVYADLSF